MEFGDISIHSLSDGSFRLDGGAMFGVVPRVLWEKTNPPDGKNRINLSISPLLIKTPKNNILVDTGIGDKWDEKFRSIYAVNRDTTLKGSLKEAGLGEDDITLVVNTHLHFDHAGGNTFVTDGGKVVPSFPNARYLLQRDELSAAINPNERTKGSYRNDDFMPVKDAGLFDLIDGDMKIDDGVSVFRTSGHNRDLQLVKVQSGGKTAIFLGDIIPTVTHLNYPFIMSYDLFPIETLKIKKEIIENAAKERWLLIFEHDPDARMGYVSILNGNPVFEKIS